MNKMAVNLGGYGNTVLGGLTIAIVAGIGWCVRNKMKHSRCDLDSGCLKVSSREDDERKSTIRLEVLEQLRREGIIPPAPLAPKLGRLPEGPGFVKPSLESSL